MERDPTRFHLLQALVERADSIAAEERQDLANRTGHALARALRS